MTHLRTTAAALTAAVALVLALAGPASAASKTEYYVSLGDSYAVGYQPGQGSTTEGFADQVVTKARKRGYSLKLVNFGCGGATTTSIIKAKGCARQARAIGGPGYGGRTQADAASRFLRAHRGQVTLVTVSIGGNDVTACARGGSDPVACVAGAVEGIKKNVGTLSKQLRSAAGKDVRIVGTTYPDVILGQWVREPVNQDLAKLSVVAFKSLINPALKATYGKVKGRLVDVTRATGAYGSLDEMTTLAPYGRIPVPVAKVCELTWYCSNGDIHSHKSGYGVIADLIVGTLPRR
jgi:lysophospholipase L1-like esterase